MSEWRKSSYSGENGCVEVRQLAAGSDGDVWIRHSKDPTAGSSRQALRFTIREWSAFLAGVKAGEFDEAFEAQGGTVQA